MSNKLDFVPAPHFVVVKAPKIEKETDGGIIKSDEMISNEKASQNDFLEVLAVGEAPESNWINVGDEICLSEGRHPSVEVDGVYYLMVHHMGVYGRRQRDEKIEDFE